MNGFLGSAALEAAINAAMVYLILAICCTAITEWIATLLDTRAKTLRVALQHLLGDQLAAFEAHPLIAGLIHQHRFPVRIPADAFRIAVLDLAKDGNFAELPPGRLREALVSILRHAEGEPEVFRKNLEEWFNNAMQRTSDAYRRRSGLISLLTAAALTVATNAKTLQMLRRPFLDEALSLSFAITWPGRIIGWTLTTGAVSLGAPFWFDLLTRLSNQADKKK